MLRQTENAFRFFVIQTARAAKTAAEKTPSPPQTRQPATENPEHKKKTAFAVRQLCGLTENNAPYAAKFSRFSVYGRRVC